jgi:predicted enzyme related to lactoylglutathione lyase
MLGTSGVRVNAGTRRPAVHVLEYRPEESHRIQTTFWKGSIMAKKKASAKKPAARAKTIAKAKTKAKQQAAPMGPDPALNGMITHTEFASTDPDATKTWLAKALGWKFGPSMPMPDGTEYHMFMLSNAAGGGIRPNTPKEVPGTVPYVQVANVKKAYAKAMSAGAEEMMSPSPVQKGLVIAIVRAPGGVAIGFAGPK